MVYAIILLAGLAIGAIIGALAMALAAAAGQSDRAAEEHVLRDATPDDIRRLRALSDGRWYGLADSERAADVRHGYLLALEDVETCLMPAEHDDAA